MERYGVEYIPADVNSVAFWEVLRSKFDTLDYLVIALGDSGRNIPNGGLHRTVYPPGHRAGD